MITSSYKPRSTFTLLHGVILLAIVLIAVAAFIGGVSGGYQVSQADFVRYMQQEGISSAVNSGYRYGAGCGEQDIYNTTFSGIKNGQPVSGIICQGNAVRTGYGKATTIRYY